MGTDKRGYDDKSEEKSEDQSSPPPTSHNSDRDQWEHGVWQCFRAAWTTTVEGHRDYPLHRCTSFSLPLSSNQLYFVSQGSHQVRGSFEISPTTYANSDHAVVDVTVSYHKPRAFHEEMVCRLHANNVDGVGIFPSHLSFFSFDHLHVHIHVHIPASPPSPTIAIRLKTELPLFEHDVVGLSDACFHDIHLNTENSPIKAESLFGKNISLRTSNAPIHGTFASTESLELATTNSPIKVHATLVNKGDGNVPSLALKTSNAPINGEIALASSASGAPGGAFHVSATTSNASLGLAVVSAPIDYTFTVDGKTSNGPACVALHRTFEGSFTLGSSPYIQPSVEGTGPVPDPAGLGRVRSVSLNQVRRGLVRGSVSWMEGNGRIAPEGRVSVETSNGPVRIIL